MTNGEARFLTGVIEGFYGAPWNAEQRLRLLEMLQEEGLNTYMYAPKDDLKHRALWRDPYRPEEVAALHALQARCRERDLLFVYGIAPGLDMAYAAEEDRRLLRAKLEPLLDGGAPVIALLFDDIPERLGREDASRFPSFAHAHVDVANALWQWMREGWPGTRLIFCPTPYCEAMSGLVEENAYLAELGASLDGAIDCFWTGPDIVSERIPAASIDELSAVIGRPPIIWDNLHANDYDMRRLFLGPIAGRAPELRSRLAGLLINPNCEFEANHNAIRTLGAYVRERDAYEPRAAYGEALRRWLPEWQTHGEAITEEELRFFCDCYHLPHRFGNDAASWLRTFEGVAGREGNQSEAGEQGKMAVRFARKVTTLRNRPLMHAIYRHAWELKEAALLLELAVERGTPLATWEYRHPIHRNGILSRVEALLPMGTAGEYRFLGDVAEADGTRSSDGSARLRLAVPGDEEALYEICLRTGDDGRDATDLYEDPKILGIIYAAPYLRLEPDLAFVLEDGEGVCGYVLGALDSEAFYRRYDEEWLAYWRGRYAAPAGPRASWSLTEQMISKLYEPEMEIPPEAPEAFPSHLHIDVLARAQGRGHGMRMILRLLSELARRGSPGVHLGVGLSNRRAIKFYHKMGFRELARGGDCLYLGLPLRR